MSLIKIKNIVDEHVSSEGSRVEIDKMSTMNISIIYGEICSYA